MFTPEITENDPYVRARLLDSLNIDDAIRQLPALNATADVDTIVSHARVAIARAAFVTGEVEAIASIRDLDFFLSSVVRHGVQPNEIVDNLDDTMVGLGEVAGTIPRGNVATYATANPTDARQRTFTGERPERLFIGAVAQTALALDSALRVFGDKNYEQGLVALDFGLNAMVNSIITVRREVTPEFFTGTLRPYFDSMTIAGKKYLGSGGAQLQLVGIDYLLWGCSDQNQEYRDFFDENVMYMTPQQQAYVKHALTQHEGQSIVDYLEKNRDPHAITTAISVLKKIKKFRYPHKKIADDNFKLRQEGSVGSGGYTPDILGLLITKNESALTRLQDTLDD